MALRAARRLGIPGRFIDLSFAEILLATREARGLRTNAEKLSYASDRYLAHNRFQERLCEKAGLRSFEEFWEKYFEVEGLALSGDAFVRLMHTYCVLARRETPEVELLEDGCLAREAHMARRTGRLERIISAFWWWRAAFTLQVCWTRSWTRRRLKSIPS